ncbi:XtrA/YqaO family protein [Lysinibacillus sp. RS11]
MDLPESCIMVLLKGVAKVAELSENAETKIITHQGQVKLIK